MRSKALTRRPETSYQSERPFHSEGQMPNPALPRLEVVQRIGPVLHPSPMPDHKDVLSLNLTRGCGHQCGFCSVRAQPSYPGDEVLYLYGNTTKLLKNELSQRRVTPAAVLVSPSCDPFPPFARVQAETARVVGVIASHGIETWLMTRGFIRPAILRMLARHANHLKVMTELTTMDRTLQRLLEPLTAPPRLRVRQIARLHELGIDVQVGLEPLIPGLTDTPQNLAGLLEALAGAGVQQVTAGYMFLRKGIAEQLQKALNSPALASEIIEAYADGPLLASGHIAPARYLPKKYRQRGYAGLMALAAGFGITVRVSATTNPDFQASRSTDRQDAGGPNSLPLFAEVGNRSISVSG
jgi:DNA repair photolyase